jgi:hypothetical protein
MIRDGLVRTQLDHGSNIFDSYTLEAYELNVPGDQIFQLFADNQEVCTVVAEYARLNLLGLAEAEEDVYLFLRMATDLGWFRPGDGCDSTDKLPDRGQGH